MNYRETSAVAEQVERLARLYFRRFQRSFGASLTVEDLEQEFWIVWVRAKEKFDSTLGYDFRAFLGISIRNEAIKLAKFHGARANIASMSLNDDTCDGAGQVIDTIPSPAPSVENEIIQSQTKDVCLSQMDERLRRMAEFLMETPEELRREVEASIAKADLGVSMGARVIPPRRLTLTMLTEMFGLSRCSRYRLIEELREITDHD